MLNRTGWLAPGNDGAEGLRADQRRRQLDAQPTSLRKAGSTYVLEPWMAQPPGRLRGEGWGRGKRRGRYVRKAPTAALRVGRQRSAR
jgi:hypothetical protein